MKKSSFWLLVCAGIASAAEPEGFATPSALSRDEALYYGGTAWGRYRAQREPELLDWRMANAQVAQKAKAQNMFHDHVGQHSAPHAGQHSAPHDGHHPAPKQGGITTKPAAQRSPRRSPSATDATPAAQTPAPHSHAHHHH